MEAFLEQINSIGKAFVNFAIPMLVQSSVLIIIVLALDFLLRKRTRSVFRYWIWMIVLVKLMLPPTLSLPTSPAYWFGNKITQVSNASEAFSTADDSYNTISPYKNRYPQTDIGMGVMVSTFYPNGYASKLPAVPSITLSWQGSTFLVWAAAFIFMVILLIRQTLFVRRLIRQSQMADGNMRDILEQARLQMGIKNKIALKLSENALSPSVCGLIRPTILIPKKLAEKINSNDLYAILLHELAHVKRYDLWISLIQAILQIIYIYNPLLWITNFIIRDIREQAVDEMVLVSMGSQAEEYPETLLNISRYSFGSVAPSLRLIGVAESKKALFTRIKHITSRPFPTSAKLGLSGMMAIIIAALIFLPMARAEKPFEIDTGTSTSLYSSSINNTPSPYELIRQAQTGQTKPAPAETPKTETERVINFPKNRSLGKLFIQMPSPVKDTRARLERSVLDCGDYLCEAQGNVRIPPDRQLTLIVDPDAAADLSGLSKLQPEDLYGIIFPPGPQGLSNDIGNAVMQHIAHLTGLKTLKLSFTNVGDAGMKYVIALKSLEYLDTTSQITDKGMAYVSQLTSLKSLGLFGPSRITDAGLQHISKMTSLEELALAGESMGDEGLIYLCNLPRLEYLRLHGTNFGDYGMVHLKKLPSLKRLSFPQGKAFISDTGLAQIAEIPNLEELNMEARGDVTDEGLAHLVKLQSLKKLSIPGAHLTDKGCAYLKQIKSLEILESSQGNQRITDVGLTHLSELPNLKSLSIHYAFNNREKTNPEPNPYGDEGLESLAKCRTLEELKIGSVAITDAGMEHVAKLSQLKKLTMLACINVTDTGIAKLAALHQLTTLYLDTLNMTIAGINSLKTMSNLKDLSVYRGLTRNNTILDISTMTNLETLGLTCDASSDPFQDADLKCLSGLKSLTNLQLGARNFSDEGLVCLRNLTNLERLSIGGPRLTDEGLKNLAGMKKLNSLQIFGEYIKNKSGSHGSTSITDKGLRYLEGFENLNLLEFYIDGDFSNEALRHLLKSRPDLTLRVNGANLQNIN
jgi:beta-lactamase regulating signal transducer with metallopeptidase domain